MSVVRGGVGKKNTSQENKFPPGHSIFSSLE